MFSINFGMVLETRMKLCMTEPDFPEKYFCPQNYENGPKMDQEQGFLNVLKKLIIDFYCICSIMKIYIICRAIPIFGKMLSITFGMVLETLMKLCMTEPDFLEEKIFAPKIGKIDQKQDFLNFFKNLVINFY